jgi:hypothetical protein
MTSLQEVNP